MSFRSQILGHPWKNSSLFIFLHPKKKLKVKSKNAIVKPNYEKKKGRMTHHQKKKN